MKDNTKNKGILFIILYLSALSSTLSQMKIVTLMGDLASQMNLSMTQASWLMSVFTLAGIVLALPGASVLEKLGPKNLLLILIACVIAGNIIGALAGSSYPVLLLSRVIEGISFAMIIMVGLVFINAWFQNGGAGIATGVFTTFPALASFICMNVSVPVTRMLGERSMWWIVAGFSAVVFVLCLLFIHNPAADNQEAFVPQEKPRLSEVITDGKMWFLAVCQACVAFILFTFITIYPQIFGGFYGLEPSTANFYASLNGLFSIAFCILSGIIIERFRNASMVVLISFMMLAIACYIMTKLSPTTYILHTFVTALGTSLVIPAVLYITPRNAKRPSLIGYSIAFVNMLYFAGNFIGTPIVTGAVEKSGSWQTGADILAGVSILGAVLIIIFMTVTRKRN